MKISTTNRVRPIRTLVLFGAVIAVLYGIMAYARLWTPNLGLDLRGGTTITLTASNLNGGAGVDAASLEQARTIIQQRVDGLGVAESEVTTSGDRQIIVSVPNMQQDELVETVGQIAQLYFRQVFEVEQVAAAPVVTTAPKANRAPAPALPTPEPSPRPNKPADVQPTTEEKLAWTPSARDERDFSYFQCGDAFPDVVDQPLITCNVDQTHKFLLGPALISGTELKSAQAGIPANELNWVVNLVFNDEGTATFTQVTAALAAQTTPKNNFAIVLDSAVISYPSVSATIPGGRAEISGSFDQESATNLANVLNYGSLPLSFEISSVDNVSATLGGNQLTAGIIAGGVGLLLVLVYSLMYYRGLAVVVAASLATAATITYALTVLLGAAVGLTLTLSGIAGVIVAIGVTADSFIIYFERIRDEARDGRTLRSAIELGWRRSRKTIVIADSVSLLSAVVLYWLAIGSVRGFAFMLGLTTLMDLAIVFWFTHPLMTLLGTTRFYGEGRPWSGFELLRLGAPGQSKRRVGTSVLSKGAR